MRSGRFFLILFIFIGAFLAPNRFAHAQTVSVSQEVKVRAVVAPAQYIILNTQGQIIEIGSNSSQATTPLVYKDNVSPLNQLPLTQHTYSSYKTLTSGGLHAGVLYRYQLLARANNTVIKTLNLLSI